MLNLKKLLCAPIFLITLFFSYSEILPFFKNPFLILSLDSQALLSFIMLSIAILLTSFSFVLFASLASDWKIILPIAGFGALLAIPFSLTSGVFIALGVFLVCVLSALSLLHILKNYLNFDPNKLFLPSMRGLSKLLSLIFCVVILLTLSNQNLKFEVPDSLVNIALQFAPNIADTSTATPQPLANLPKLSKDQITLLKQDPALLKQYGLNANTLDQIIAAQQSPQQSTASLMQSPVFKNQVKQEIQNMLLPYQQFMPLILSALLYLTLTSFVALGALILYPLTSLTFMILEKTGYLKFSTEQRTVKKMVI